MKTIHLVSRLPQISPANGIFVKKEHLLLPDRSLKTVVLETPKYVEHDSDDSSDCETVVSADGSKKRRRLTNLSHDEKILRRKLKNREAAQMARDRKKMKMSQLEEDIAALQSQNKKLKDNNENLLQYTNLLAKENLVLKQQLELAAVTSRSPQTELISSSQIPVVTGSSTEPASESAVLGTPLPWEQARSMITQLTTQCLMSYLVILGLIFSWSCSKNSTNQSIKTEVKQEIVMPMNSTNQSFKTEIVTPSLKTEENPLLRQWWGRHQKNWNPSMNS